VFRLFGSFRVTEFAFGWRAKRWACAVLWKFVWAKLRGANLLRAKTECTGLSHVIVQFSADMLTDQVANYREYIISRKADILSASHEVLYNLWKQKFSYCFTKARKTRSILTLSNPLVCKLKCYYPCTKTPKWRTARSRLPSAAYAIHSQQPSISEGLLYPKTEDTPCRGDLWSA
jgi:hypothetical protein